MSLKQLIDFSDIRVLVTTNIKVARAFASSFGSKKAKQICADLGDTLYQGLLLNPYDPLDYQKFFNLEYSLGYSSGGGEGDNNFQITLKLYDFTGFLEDSIVDQMFDIGFLQENIKTFITRINSLNPPTQPKKITNKSFTSDIVDINTPYVNQAKNAFLNEDNLNFYNEDLNDRCDAIRRHFYFIFINQNNDYLNPITSQLYATEVAQNSSNNMLGGNRELTLKFICAGHPTLLSKLASIKNYDSNSLKNNPDGKLIKTEYSLDREIDLLKLSNNSKELDTFIKSIFKDLFREITGREVVIVLPDFGKIFENYLASESVSLTKVPLEYVSNSANFTILNYYNSLTLNLRDFLKRLGFSIFDTEGKGLVADFVLGLKPDDKYFLKSFSSHIEKIAKSIKDPSNRNNDPTKLFKLVIADDAKKIIGDINYTLTPNQIDLTEEESRLFSFYTTGGRFIPQQMQQLSREFNNATYSVEQVQDKLINLLQLIYLTRLTSIAEQYDRKDLKSVILAAAPSSKQGAEVNGFTLDPNRKVWVGKINFTITSKEEPQSGAPKLKNQIDFNEFANNFSNNLNFVAQDSSFNNFNIFFTEENNVGRLKIIKEKLLFNGFSQINTDSSPCIVIADKWLFDNYYNPITGSLRDAPDGYPISDEDLKNYSKDSEYIKDLIKLKNNSKFIKRNFTIPFNPNVKIFSDNDSLDINSQAFTTNFAINTLEEISPQLFSRQVTTGLNPLFFPVTSKFIPESTTSKSFNKRGVDYLIKPINLFIHNANPSQDRIIVDPLTGEQSEITTNNIVSFELTADTLNAFASMNAFLKFYQDSIVDDELLTSNLDYIRYTLGSRINIDSILLEIKKHLGDPVKLDQIFTGFQNEFNDYFELTNVTDPRAYVEGRLAKDFIDFFGTPQDAKSLEDFLQTGNASLPDQALNQELNQKAEDIYSKIDRIKQKALSRCFEILTSYSLQTNKNGVVKARSEYLRSPEGRAAELYNLIYNRVYTLTINTHATFQINSISELNSPTAILIYRYYGDRAGFPPDYNSEKRSYLRQLSPISGMYRIIGFKHTLQSTQDQSVGSVAKSQFILVKDLNVGSTG